jgi:carboxymethylenebutenolidase
MLFVNNKVIDINWLHITENVNSSKIASIGWCFVGGQSLELAVNSEPDYLL